MAAEARISEYEDVSQVFDGSGAASLITAAPGVELDTLEWCKIAVGEKIASGSFGDVYRGEVFGTPAAIKVFKKQGSTLKMKMAELRKEIDVMRRIRHPNVVSLLGISTTPTEDVVIVMELMKGNLNDFRRLHPNLHEFDRLKIATQLARGLSWLHTRTPPILHLDLKFDNVLFDSAGAMKVTDFGLSAFLPEEYIMSELRLPGNIGHMAPEIIKRLEFNTKADVFSFGILFWEVMKWLEWEQVIVEHLTNAKLKTTGDLGQIVKAAIVYKNFRPELPAHWVPSLRHTLQQSWHADMSARPTMQQLISDMIPTIDREMREQFIHNSLQDEVACDIWRQHFWQEIPNLVNAQALITAFYAKLKLPYPDDPDNLDLCFLHLALDIDSPAEDKVSIERFSKVVAAFGPLQPDNPGRFFQNIVETLSEPWFHPEEEANKPDFLFGQPEGTFIVRFSRHAAFPFTLSRVGADAIHHTRIAKNADGSFSVQLTSSVPTQLFDSLKQLIENPEITSVLHLTSPKSETYHRAMLLRQKFQKKGDLYDFDELSADAAARVSAAIGSLAL